MAPDARLAQHLKNVRLMLSEAAAMGANAPLTHLHEQVLSAAVEMVLEAAGNSHVVEVFRKNTYCLIRIFLISIFIGGPTWH